MKIFAKINLILVLCLFYICFINAITYTTYKVNVGSVNLNVAFAGSNGTHQLVFLHGWPEAWFAWNEVATQILKQSSDFNLVIPDLKGFNMSDKPLTQNLYNSTQIASEITSLFRRTGQPVVLVGHDWGGMIAWIIASQYPTLVEALIILNAPHPNVWESLLKTDSNQQNASSYIFDLQQPDAAQLLVANNYALLNDIFDSYAWYANVSSAYQLAWSQKNEVQASLNYFNANLFVFNENWANLKTNFPPNLYVKVPTLVFWGQTDKAYIFKNTQLLSQYVSSLTLRVYPSNSHWIHHEIPSEIATHIISFVNSL
eukprot:TRINITY_DN143_c0_g1_i1.p1 TRINITY_DN143_c0_g1~~TRINITY_DN143_c0_g1_i1.p1  ORF type:complete len:314 (-),score=123.59 TRINITY_DN143_c0_g1_i1:170-1111(-)